MDELALYRQPLRELALFAGCGGGLYGSHLCGFRTIAAVEICEWCRETLLQRQLDGVFPMFPIEDDVRGFDGRPFRGLVDIITGGDPCQENSAAFQHGTVSVRSLGGEFIRVVGEVRPEYVMRENPARVRAEAPWPADRFAAELEALGYTTTCVEIRACCLGADHQRGRLWVLGRLDNSNSQRRKIRPGEESTNLSPGEQHATGSMARAWKRAVADELRRGPDGCANRRKRLQRLGEMQVPRMVQAAWELLTGTLT